jgi:hypothetical protein
MDTDSAISAPTVVYSGTALSATVSLGFQKTTYYFRVRVCDASTGTCGTFATTGSNGVLYSLLDTPNRFALNAPPDDRHSRLVRGAVLLSTRRLSPVDYTETRS